MDFEAVKSGIDSKSIILIDVRNPGELQTDGKIPGSYNIPREYLSFYICTRGFEGATSHEFGLGV